MFLPEKTQLGHLKIIEVYDYYDGPRLFAAQNTVGTIFLAFWADQSDEEDIWLYVPMSTRRLDEIRSGLLELRKAYLESEDSNVFLVYTSLFKKKSQVCQVTIQELDKDLLPVKGDVLDSSLFLQESEDASETVKFSSQASFQHYQELYLTNIGKSNTSSEGLVSVIDSWSVLIRQVMANLGFSGSLFTQALQPGSLKLYFGTNSPEISSQALSIVGNLLNEKEPGQIFQILIENNINYEDYDRFLKSIVDNSINIKISSVIKNTKENVLQVTDEHAKYSKTEAELVREVLYETIVKTGSVRRIVRMSGKKFPQADNIDKIFDLVEVLDKREVVSSYSLGVHPRQVYYYTDAAKVLGYINADKYLTSTGRYLISLNHEQKMWLTAIQFMMSECGMAWMRWSDVHSFTQIKAETANSFISETAVGLSLSTIKRRAKTLMAWYRQLTPFVPDNLRYNN